MKMNVKWVWTVSALLYVALVLIGYTIYDEFFQINLHQVNRCKIIKTSPKAKSFFYNIVEKPTFLKIFHKKFTSFCSFLSFFVGSSLRCD